MKCGKDMSLLSSGVGCLSPELINRARIILLTGNDRDAALKCFACGAFVMSTHDIDPPFIEGRDWIRVCRETEDGKIRHYLDHPDEAARIGDSGHRAFLKDFGTEEAKFLESRTYFFIVGSQRSGTTLMEFIVGSHPDVAVFGEPKVYNKLTNRNPEPRNKVLGFKIPSWTHRHAYFREQFPNAKVIFMERDLKQIAASMIALREWIPKVLDLELTAAISGVTDKSLKELYKSLQDKYKASGEGYMGAALCAYVNQSHYAEYVKLGFKTMRVGYDSLVTESKTVIGSVLAFLCLPWHDRVLDHSSCHRGVYTGQNNSKRPIDADSLNRWKTILSHEQIAKIDDLDKLLSCR